MPPEVRRPGAIRVPIRGAGGWNPRVPGACGRRARAADLRPAPGRRRERPAARAASWSRTKIHHTAQTHGHTAHDSTTAHDGVRSRDLRDTSVSGTWVTLRRVTMIILQSDGQSWLPAVAAKLSIC